MKLLVITWNYPPTVGGIEQVAYHLTQGLRSHGDHVTVIAAGAPISAAAADVDANIHRARKPGMAAFFIHAVTAGLRMARREKPDAIICPSLTSAPAAWIVSRFTGTPYCVLIHGSDVMVPSKFYQTVIRFLMSGARLLFANSQHTAHLIEGKGYSAGKIRVVNPGVTPPPKPTQKPGQEIVDLLARIKNRPTLLSVGRLVKRKGIIEFVDRVLPELIETFPDLVYLIVGDEPKASLIHHERILDQLKMVIEKGGHAGRVKLLGRISDADLHAVYQQTGLFIMPCLDDPNDIEGFGIVILEAALNGVPAVATRTGGIPDAIVDDETGKLVAAGDNAALAGAIRNMLSSEELRNAMGVRACARVNSHFTWNAIAAQYRQGLIEITS